MRSSAVGCLSGSSNTPNMDNLAIRGTVFEEAVANGPGTPQSFPPIFTSTYPLMHKNLFLSKSYLTLAGILQNRGFVTAGFHSNPFLSTFFGWNRGFQHFMDLSSSHEMSRMLGNHGRLSGLAMRFVKRLLNFNRFRKVANSLLLQKRGYSPPYLRGEEMNRIVLDWLGNLGDRRSFLWVHYMDPHRPYLPPVQWLGGFGMEEALDVNKRLNTLAGAGDNREVIKDATSLYELEVKYVDHCVGGLLESLEHSGLIDETLVVLTADHGEAIFDHGECGHPAHLLYEELIHVPLILYGIDDEKRVDRLVEHLDIAPTVLGILGIKKPKTFVGNGLHISKAGIISESANFSLDGFKYDFGSKVVSYRTKEWKFILDNSKGKKELYNLEKDPEERRNVLDDNRDLTETFRQRISSHVSYLEKIRSHAS